MYCETCPVIDYCEAYKKAKRDNYDSYHPQQVVRVNDCDEPNCPLLDMIRKR